CSGFHHKPICSTNASYTLAAGAWIFVSSFTRKPVGVTCGADCADVLANTSRAVVNKKRWRMFPASKLRGFRGFHLFGVLAETRFAIAPRAVMERRLSSTKVCFVPFPSFKDRSLQSAPIGKAQLPRQARHTIHRVQMLGGLLIGLAPREKYNTRHG